MLLAIILVLVGTLGEEIGDSLGKIEQRKRLETNYSFAFLILFWGSIFFVISILFGADFRFTASSLPTFIPRILLEILLLELVVLAIVKSARSTYAFMRTLTIPMLLVVDIVLKYPVTVTKAAGVLVMFLALGILLFHNPVGKKGAKAVALSAMVAVITVSLFKYNITHFNSVAAEQLVLLLICLGYFGVMGIVRGHQNPLRLIFRPITRWQSLGYGISTVLISFALNYTIASVLIGLKRSFAVFWSIVSGRQYFHEHGLFRKAFAMLVLSIGIVLSALPT